MKQVEFYIEGMSCAACSSGIERSLGRKEYCQNIEVNLLTKKAKIAYDEDKASLEDIFAFIAKLGYTPYMESPHAPSSLKSTPESTQEVISESSAHATSLASSLTAPFASPFTATPTTSATPTATHSTTHCGTTPASPLFRLNALIEAFDARFLNPTRKITIALLCSLLALMLSFEESLHFLTYSIGTPSLTPLIAPLQAHQLLLLLLSLIVMHMGRGIYFRGFRAFFHKIPNMDTLIGIGSGSAFIYSLWGMSMGYDHLYFDSVCVIVTLVLVGKSIEERSKKEAMDSASMLLRLYQKPLNKVLLNPISQQFSESSPSQTPPLQSLLEAQTQSVRADSVKEGEVLKILPGEMIMLDCTLLYSLSNNGNARLDCSAINGESIPASCQSGDLILSGSLNLDAIMYVRAIKESANSTLAQILSLVQRSQEGKAPIASLADKIAAYFVPGVILLALLAGGLWWYLRDFAFGAEIFIATLVISCPCALGLATPMAILHASSVAHQLGVLFRTPIALESLAHINHIIFDKSGTLTEGLEIAHITPLGGRSEVEIFAIAKALESGSSHIIAKAFEKPTGAFKHDTESKHATQIENLIGYGLKGTIEGIEYALGNFELLTPQVQAAARTFTHTASSTSQISDEKIKLYLASNDELLGVIYLQDSIKGGAKAVLKHFTSRGISLSLLSGDELPPVRCVAQELGISDFQAKAKPEDKMRVVSHLQQGDKKVLMVGDGINDSPALSAAYISAAFTSPNDIATNSAQIVLYNPRIESIYHAWRLSQATLKNIKQNLGFAFCYNIVLIPIAMGALGGFGIFLHPMFCAFAMSASSLSVIANAARLRLFK